MGFIIHLVLKQGLVYFHIYFLLGLPFMRYKRFD